MTTGYEVKIEFSDGNWKFIGVDSLDEGLKLLHQIWETKEDDIVFVCLDKIFTNEITGESDEDEPVTEIGTMI